MLSSAIGQPRFTVTRNEASLRVNHVSKYQGAHSARSCQRLQPVSKRSASTVAYARSESSWSLEKVLGRAVPAVAYATLIFYALKNTWGMPLVLSKFAPDQTPLRDQYFLEKLVGLGVDDGVPINPVFFSLFNLMGIYPVIYGSLMIPSARGSVVPVWPFVSLSFGLGIFGLFPYLLFWDLEQATAKSPPDSSELATGWGKYALQAVESQILPAALLVATIGLLFNAFSSGIGSWNAFFRLFDESKFVHVTSLDFVALTACLPLFLWNDSQKRGVEWNALPLAALPLVGPLIYLILRPRASKSE